MDYRFQRLYIFTLHTLLIISALVCLATGLRFAATNRIELAFIRPLLPQGQLHDLHQISALVFTACVACYILFRLITYFSQTKAKPSEANSYHKWVNRVGYLICVSLFASGWGLWWQAFPLGANWHYFSAIGLILYLLLHSYIHWLQLGSSVVKRSIPLKMHASVGAALICSVILTTSAMVVYKSNSQRLLQVSQLPQNAFIEVDGFADEDIWHKAHALEVMTYGGANFFNGQTQVSIQAAANEHEVFFLIRWQDTSESREHLPLVKTATHWQVKQNGFHQFDEKSYYEDKFAIMLSSSCQPGADGTALLGRNPLSDKPANWHGKGYHASLDGRVRDLWQWKAVRTNDMYLADDNVFAAPAKHKSGQRRYKAGYMADGKESGAYVMNWQWYSPEQITPKRLPKSDAFLSAYQVETKKQTWVLPWFEFTPYSAQDDSYPVNTIMPSVLYRSNRFEGDRADVRARGIWQDGFWTLELVRAKDTGSMHDIPLTNDTCLWVAAFDHAQTAHTRHERPIKLNFNDE